MARNYRKVSDAHGRILAAHAALNSDLHSGPDQVWKVIGYVLATLDAALEDLGQPDQEALDRRDRTAALGARILVQPELPFEV